MKRKLRLVSALILALALLALPLPPAHADEEDAAGRSWDELVQELLEKHNAEDGQVTLGYWNTATGEEQYYDPDRFMLSGSMYKVPLCMVFVEKEAAGEIEWTDLSSGGYRYETLVKGAIVDSNNDYARELWKQLGSYNAARRAMAPYMGEDPDAAPEEYYDTVSHFTAREMISCLKQLYENPDPFSYIVDLMKQAQQNEYFCRDEKRYQVAHKYGWVADDAKGILYLTDCGIVYTDDPYALVCFTAGVEEPYRFLAEYCTLMSDYTQVQRTARLEAEAEEEAARREAERLEAERRAAEEAERQTAENGAVSSGGEPEPTPNEPEHTPNKSEQGPSGAAPGNEEEEKPFALPGWAVAAAAFVLFALITGIDAWKKGGIDLKRAALVFAALLFGLLFWLIFTSQ